MHALIGLFWQKKMVPFGATFIAALEDEHLHMLHIGNALAGVKLTLYRGPGVDPLQAYTINKTVGQAVANRMVKGYTETAEANLKAFEEGGVEALQDRPKSISFSRSAISDVRVLDKQGMMDPAAAAHSVKTSGLIAFKADGKDWRLALREVDRAGTEAFAQMLR